MAAAEKLLAAEREHLDRLERQDAADDFDRMSAEEMLIAFRQMASELAGLADPEEVVDAEIVEPHRPALAR